MKEFIMLPTSVLTTNSANFHKSGAASPENFIVGMIRANSGNSRLKCVILGHPSRTGSFVF